ncbi:MAG TPA: DUF58 domain-containing protein [Planctomycetes bacterium]|nr:DUF58 domain-containing protein [Planctomycetota bacterium]
MAAVAHKYLDPRSIGRLRRVSVVARGVVEGFISGLHKSPYLGFSTEFAEHREYVPGDNLRYLDWKVAARTDREYIKVFEEETNVRCHLLLDISGSMGYSGTRSRGLTKLEYSCYLAGALAYLMIRQRDPVGLVAFGGRIERHIAPRSTAQHLGLILEALETIRTGGGTSIGGTFHELAERMRRRSLVVVLSDLLDDADAVHRAMHHFRHRKHEVVLFHVLDPDEMDLPFGGLVDFVDMENGERIQIDPASIRETYTATLNDYTRRVRRSADEAGAAYIPAATSTPYDLLLARYLMARKHG